MAIQPIGTLPPAFTPTVADASYVRVTSPSSQAAEPAKAPQAPQQASSDNGTGQRPSARKDEIEQALNKVNEFVQSRASDVQFLLDDETGIRVVKVLDRSTKEVIRQIPSEEMLHIAQALDKLQGLLIRQKA